MLIFPIIAMLFCLVYSLAKREMNTPLFFFSTLWLTVLLLYSMRLFRIYTISTLTEIVIFLGLSCFVIGYYFCASVSIRIKGISSVEILDNYRLWAIISIVVTVAASPFYLGQLANLLAGGTLEENKLGLVSGLYDSGGVLMQYFVRPFLYIILAISAHCIINRKHFIIMSCGFILTAFEFLGTGAKTIVFYYGLCLLIAYSDSFDLKKRVSKNTKPKKKVHIKILIALSFLTIVLYMLSVAESVLHVCRSLYFYLCGCIPMLSKVLSDYQTDGFTYGFLSFNSFFRFVFNVLEMFGVEVKSKLFDTANMYYERFEYTTSVAPDVSYNAFTTFIADFYLDFGVPGVIILSLLFGIVSCSIYKKFKKNSKSVTIYVKYCLLMYCICFSIVRFQLSYTIIGVAFIYIYFLSFVMRKRKKVSISENKLKGKL